MRSHRAATRRVNILTSPIFSMLLAENIYSLAFVQHFWFRTRVGVFAPNLGDVSCIRGSYQY